MASGVPSPSQLNDVIQQTLRDIMGDMVAAFLLGELERKHGVESSGIVNRPDALSTLLKHFFGSGGEAIESTIVLRWSQRFDREIRSRTLVEGMAELVGKGREPGRGSSPMPLGDQP